MRIGLGLVATAFLLTACQAGINDDSEDTSQACEGPLGKPVPKSQLTSMTACCQAEAGQAHCLGSDKVPSQLQPFVATCDAGGYCIPDSFLETGASEPP